MPRTGEYFFNFQIDQDKVNIVIKYYQDEQSQAFIASLSGTLQGYSRKNLLTTLLRYPHITFATLILIHYQALKLWLKKVKFYKLPRQIKPKFSLSKSHQ